MSRTIPGNVIPPGIYSDLDNREYHASAALSSSSLGALARSPAHYLASRATDDAKPEYSLGGATHDLVLYGELSDEYVRSEFADYRTKAARQWRDEQIAAGRRILPTADYDAAQRTAEAVRAHPVASQLVEQGQRECSYFWDDAGIPCRCRPDSWVADAGVIVDLKTTRDASPDAFRRSAANFGYGRQAAFYWRGLDAFDLNPRAVIIIAAEKDPPFGVAVYHLDDAWIERGAEQVASAMVTVSRWLAGDGPDCYPETIQVLTAPGWL